MTIVMGRELKDSRKLASLVESCQNMQALAITRGGSLDGLSFALRRGACQHLTELHIFSEGATWAHKDMFFFALAIKEGALPSLEVLSVGPGLSVLDDILISFWEGRVSPLLREMHFYDLSDGDMSQLARVLQARASTTAKGLERLEGTWTARSASSVEAMKRIAQIVLPTLKGCRSPSTATPSSSLSA